MRRRWLAAVLATTFTWLLPAAAGAQDKPIELKFSSWVSAVHGHHTGVMVPWVKMVEEKSGGRLKITIFPGSTLGKAVDHYDMVKDGIADMGFTTPGYTPGRFPLITATELPLLFKSSRGGSLAVMAVFDKYFKAEFKDVKVLWFWVHPPGHFHLAKKQVKVLEDLNGLKIRAATPMLTTMVKTLGAVPVSIPAPDTYTALERGTVDGTIFPWEAISSFKIAFMNQKKYDSLPPDLRKVIDDLSGNWGAEFNGKVWDQNELVGIEAIKKAGGTIYTLPPEERQRWAAKLKPMEEDWVKSMDAKGLPGRQLLGDLREAIKRYDP